MNDREPREQSVAIDWPGDNAHAVVVARKVAGDLGFQAVPVTLIATAVSELTTNIIKYAGRGIIHLRPIRENGRTGIEISAEDSGPGIPDPESAMREQFSTGGSLGLGIPAVKRIMDSFELTTIVGKGTCVTVRKWRED